MAIPSRRLKAARFSLTMLSVALLQLASVAVLNADPCQPSLRAGMDALAKGRIDVAEKHLYVAIEAPVASSCSDLSSVILAALIVAEADAQKTLAAQALEAIGSPATPKSERLKWEGAAHHALSALSTTLRDHAALLSTLPTTHLRHVRWDMPAEPLIKRMEQVLGLQEETIQDLHRGQWNPEFTTPVFLMDYAYLTFLTNCNEYWDPGTHQLDVAGVLCDYGTILLYMKTYDIAGTIFDQVLRLTEKDTQSDWRAYAKYGLREIVRRRAEGE